jgi:uncharacterized protein YdeI (YjbR/CyaY-like superfamily)
MQEEDMADSIDSLQILTFKRSTEWRDWLAGNFDRQDGIWLRFYKKASETESIRYAEALDEALCYGWIDGQAKKYDDQSYLQKFTPRRPRSIWSKRNIEHVARLTREGRMQLSGIKQVEAAKADGRWENAYDSPSSMEIPADFYAALDASPQAKEFFATLNRTNIYAIAWRLQTAKKPETRQRRLEAIIKMLESGEKFH